MQAIEFETVAQNHLIRIPENIPNGISIRVLLLVDDKIAMPKKIRQQNSELKTLLTNTMEGLDDSDFERTRDFGREQPEWDF